MAAAFACYAGWSVGETGVYTAVCSYRHLSLFSLIPGVRVAARLAGESSRGGVTGGAAPASLPLQAENACRGCKERQRLRKNDTMPVTPAACRGCAAR